MSYYHYTKGCHLGSIVKEGIIRTAKAGVEKREKPAVWLTKSPEWDSSCNIGRVTNIDQLEVGRTYSSKDVQIVTATNDYMKKEIGMCRILISEKIQTVSWAKFKHVSGISERMYYALDEVSKEKGSPVNLWLCTFFAIPKKYWEGIEMFVENKWVRWDEQMLIEQFVELCMECNGHKIDISVNHPKYVYDQLDFIKKHNAEIVDFWEANKHKKGYIEIFVTPDYKPYECGFQFIEKRVRKSSFKPLSKSKNGHYALVHLLWEATFTQYKLRIGYEMEAHRNPIAMNFNQNN